VTRKTAANAIIFSISGPTDQNTRVAIGLIYARESLGRNEWMALIKSEVGNLEFAARD